MTRDYAIYWSHLAVAVLHLQRGQDSRRMEFPRRQYTDRQLTVNQQGNVAVERYPGKALVKNLG